MNIRFDKKYEKLYLALIAGLSGLGLTPRCVLEIPPGKNRLHRIFGLIQSCRSSIHDLLRVELSQGQPRCPRFNMPFELGLAVGWAQASPGKHNWFVVESMKFRLQKSLSDLNGFEVFVHNGTVNGLLDELTNVFVRAGYEVDVGDLAVLYRDLRKFAEALKKRPGSHDLFRPQAFFRLVIASQEFARRRGFVSKRES